MKILYINVIEQNAGWGAECFVNRGFLENGHQTVTLDYRKHRAHLGKRFLALEQDFDLLFLQRGDGFPLELLRAVNRPKFFWASELVERNRDQDRLLQSSLFDHVFVRTPRCKEIICQNGWIEHSRVSILLSGFDERVHQRHEAVERDIDVLFVGHLLPRRRAWLDRLSEQFSVVVERSFGEEMSQLFNRAKVVLNIHAEEFADTETRVFEALGCGSFLLSETLSEESPFADGVHLVEARGVEEMESALAFYLNHPVERERIACAGHIEALSRHTYRCRAAELAETFGRYRHCADIPALDTAAARSYARKQGLQNGLNGIRSRVHALLGGGG